MWRTRVSLVVILSVIITVIDIVSAFPQVLHQQQQHEEQQYPPVPYEFGFQDQDKEGRQQSRHESKDASGVVRGQYTLTDEYGNLRVVDYVADANGFHANVQTSEPGVETHAPSNALIVKTAG